LKKLKNYRHFLVGLIEYIQSAFLEFVGIWIS